MELDPAVWGPPVGVLVVGIGVAAAIALSRRPADPGEAFVREHRADLEELHDSTVRGLKELELEREKMPADEYEKRRRMLLGAGAAVLAMLDGKTVDADNALDPRVRAMSAAQREATKTRREAVALSDAAIAVLESERARLGPARFELALAQAVPSRASGWLAPEWKGALWTLGAFAVVGGLAWAAGNIATPRQDMPAPTVAAPGPEEAALQTRVAANPNDIEALNELTVLAMSRQDGPGAMRWSDRALAVDPKNADARVNRALLTSVMGMDGAALAKIDEVLAELPEHPTANVYKGILLLKMDRPAEAVPFLERAIGLGVNSPAIVQALDEARARAEGGTAGALPDRPPAEVIVTGTITVDPAAEAALGGAKVLFVSVRDPAAPGPPLAAKKLPVGPFPLAFTLTTHDRPMMMGNRGLPATFDVTVRADFDGQATSKDPAEPVAVAKGVAMGAGGVAVVLAPPAP